THFLLEDAAQSIEQAALSFREAQMVRASKFGTPAPAFLAERRRGGSGIVRDSGGPSPELYRDMLAEAPALRRARRMRPSIAGSRMLWIDDTPERAEPERRMLELLGGEVVGAKNTEGALALLTDPERVAHGRDFDLIISDIA